MAYRGRDGRRGGGFGGGRMRDNQSPRNVDDIRGKGQGSEQPGRSQPQAAAGSVHAVSRGPGGQQQQNRGQSNGQQGEPKNLTGTSVAAVTQQNHQPLSQQGKSEESAVLEVPPSNQAASQQQAQNRKENDGTSSSNKAQGDQQFNKSEKRFSGRCRLFVGNLPSDMSDEQFGIMFKEFGEITEVFLNAKKGFGFVKMETRAVAEAAKSALDGRTMKGRQIRVRFATHGAALRVKNLPAVCSNELLADAFSEFGEVERAVVIVDDKGKSSGEGIVEFSRKPACNKALAAITEGVFMLTRTPRPILVELLEQKDDEDGLPDKYVPKNNDYQSEMEEGPRFAAVNSFEYEFGQRWKRLDVLERDKMEQVRREMKEARENLEMEMDSALHEYKADLLRQDLMRRQAELDRLESDKQKRELMKRRDLEVRRQQQPQYQQRPDEQQQQQQMRQQQDDAMRRGSPFGPPHQQFGPPPPQSPFGGLTGGPSGNYGPPPSARDDGNQLLQQSQQAPQREMQNNPRGAGGLTAMQPPPIPLGSLNFSNAGPMGQGMPPPPDFGGPMPPLRSMARFEQSAAPNFNSSQGPMMGGPAQSMSGGGSGGPSAFQNMPAMVQAAMIRPPRDGDQYGDPKRRRFH